MEIVNLASPTSAPQVKPPRPTASSSKLPYLLVVVFALISGFGLSRLTPSSSTGSNLIDLTSDSASPVSVSDPADLKVGLYYGDKSGDFPDSAIGVIEEGSINGEGTHILIREGGVSQRASLTSSVVDLDMFVGKKVEVKGQTNSSNKASWLMDVGALKILE